MTDFEVSLSPLIVQIATPTCRPCKVMRPLAEQAADDLDVEFAHIYVSDAPTFTEEHAVMSVPTFLVFNHGLLVGRMVGTHSPEELADQFGQMLDG